MNKRVLSLVVVLAMTVMILPFGSVVASAATPSIGFSVNGVTENGVVATAAVTSVDVLDADENIYRVEVTVDFAGTTGTDSIFAVWVESSGGHSYSASFTSLSGNDSFTPVTVEAIIQTTGSNVDDLELIFRSIPLTAEPVSSMTWGLEGGVTSGTIDLAQALSSEGFTIDLPTRTTTIYFKGEVALSGIWVQPNPITGMGGPDGDTPGVTAFFNSVDVSVGTVDFEAKTGSGVVLATYRINFNIPTDNNNNNNNSSSSDRDSGSSSSGNRSSNTTSSVPANTPVTVTQAAVNSAVSAATAAGNTSVNIRNPGEISLAVLRSITMPLQADSMTLTGAVDVRITLDPSQATQSLNLSASTTSPQATRTTNQFGKFLSNDLMTVALGQQGSFGQEVRIAAKLDTSLNTDNLVFYAYDRAANIYRIIPNSNYRIDSNGYVHFNTTLGGDIIISDGTLTRR